MEIKVLIIEDEVAAARRLEKMLLNLEPNMTICDILQSNASSIAWLKENPHPNLILMDIHLEDGLSFDIFNHVDVKTPVIFITAYDQYAIRAFKVNSIDYLLKPIKEQELIEAIKKFKELIGHDRKVEIDYQQLAAIMEQQLNPHHHRFVVQIGQQMKVIPVSDSAYFYTKEKIVFVCTKEGRNYPLDYNLDQLDHMLGPRQFFRVNRQFIVGITSIHKMHNYSRSRVKLELNPQSSEEVIVSTERASDFKNWLSGQMPSGKNTY